MLELSDRCQVINNTDKDILLVRDHRALSAYATELDNTLAEDAQKLFCHFHVFPLFLKFSFQFTY